MGGALAAAWVAYVLYNPALPLKDQLMGPFGGAAFAAASAGWAWFKRWASETQIITFGTRGAEKRSQEIAEERAAITVSNVAAGVAADRAANVATNGPPPLSAEERAQGWTTVKPEDVPMDHLPLNKVRHEINDVADSVLDIMQGLARLSPLLGVLGTVGKVVEVAREAAKEESRP
jgi:hypothetical protein